MKSHGKSKAVIAAVIFEVNLLQSSRFGEALRIVQDHLDSDNFYAFNPAFDAGAGSVGRIGKNSNCSSANNRSQTGGCGNGNNCGCTRN